MSQLVQMDSLGHTLLHTFSRIARPLRRDFIAVHRLRRFRDPRGEMRESFSIESSAHIIFSSQDPKGLPVIRKASTELAEWMLTVRMGRVEVGISG